MTTVSGLVKLGARAMGFSTVLFVGGVAAAGHQQLVTEFTSASPDLAWRVVNDNVMGGRSAGTFVVDAGDVVFTGSTNTYGGGFSSIRTGPLELNLSDFDGIRIRVLGDGRRYTWRLATDVTWRNITVGYWADFATAPGTWTDVSIPFSDFVPQVRGTRLSGPDLNRAMITGMGLMIYDGKDGAFSLRLSSVHAFSNQTLDLSAYRWKKRILVLSAPAADDESLTATLAQVETTRDDFENRDMVVVVLLDDDQSGAAHELREKLGFETQQFGLRLLGKDGGIKRSENKLTDLSEVYAQIDTMPMRRQEMDDETSSK